MVVERESFMIAYPMFHLDHIDLQEILETDNDFLINILNTTTY